jgi:hypothetical protein
LRPGRFQTANAEKKEADAFLTACREKHVFMPVRASNLLDFLRK